MSTTTVLVAPAGVTQAVGLSGTIYTVANGLVTVNAGDVIGLLNNGYTLSNASALNNLAATTNPGLTNDNTQGYAVGSVWVNITLGGVYVATGVATGAANWQRTGGEAPITIASTATSFPNAGVVVMQTSRASSYTLANPVAGCEVDIINNVNSTKIHFVRASSAGGVSKFLAAAGASKTSLKFTAEGQVIKLRGLSATLWAITSNVNAVTTS